MKNISAYRNSGSQPPARPRQYLSGKSAGFTLIETVVAGILIAVLAMGLYALFTMYIKNSRELTADFKIQRNYDGLMDDFGRRVRAASRVFTLTEFKNSDFALIDKTDVTTLTVALVDFDNNLMIAYNITNNYIEISDNGIDWRPFIIANDTVKISSVSAHMRRFTLNSNRTAVSLDIPLMTVMAGDTVNLHIKEGVFLCRL
ncbi:MAG: prepilin-type N-terminal cleavage/methylation domain-containing protein [Chitinispirillales bacterium]|jgi:type II secretory pathway pseudopilin PulG|nr:prepilin-type N-terminal cleavage/methylation domain-containing protein [Chitinispirillales bacterium]